MNRSKNMAVTRPVGEGSDTAELIRGIGWEPFIVHTVELKPYEKKAVRQILDPLLSRNSVDWFVLMSRTGVDFLFEALGPNGISVLPPTRIVAVGPRTFEALHAHGIDSAIIPDNYSSEGIAELLAKESIQGKRIVLLRSSEADNVLAKQLEALGGLVTTVKLYRSSIPSDTKSVLEFLRGLRKVGRFQAVLFTSAVTASNMFRIASRIMPRQELASRLSSIIVGAIGPVTAQKLTTLGVKSIVPASYTIGDGVRVINETYEEMAAASILH